MFERPERMDAILKELDRRQFGILIAGVEDLEPYFFWLIGPFDPGALTPPHRPFAGVPFLRPERG